MRFNSHLKGQSAIEYLMTYGWMLLVIAIVGGLLFALFQDQELEGQSVEGFEGEDVRVEDVASGNGSVQLELASYSSEGLSDVRVCLSNSSRSFCSGSLSLERLGSETLGFPANESDEGFSYDVNASFTSGSGLSDSVSGSLTVDAFVTGSPSENVGNNPDNGGGDGPSGDGPDDGGDDPVGTSSPYFKVQGVSSDASSSVAGDTVVFDFTVNNTGESSGEQTVALGINGSERDSTSVSVGAGGDSQVSLSWSTESGDAGPFDYSISSENDSVSGSSSLSSGDSSTNNVGEDFEDGSLSNYDVYNSSVWSKSSTIEGSSSLTVDVSHSISYPENMVSYGGGNLDYYPEMGDSFSILYKPDSSGGGFMAGMPDGTNLSDQKYAAGLFLLNMSGTQQISAGSAGSYGQGSLSTNLSSGQVYELEAEWYKHAIVFDVYEYTVGDGRGSSVLEQPIKLSNNGSMNSESGFAWLSYGNQGSPEYDMLRKTGEVSDPDKVVIDLNLTEITNPNYRTDGFNPDQSTVYNYTINTNTYDGFRGQWGETVDLEYTFNEPNGSSTVKTASFVVGEEDLSPVSYSWGSSGSGSIDVQATYNGSSDYTLSKDVTVQESATETTLMDVDSGSEFENHFTDPLNFEVYSEGVNQTVGEAEFYYVPEISSTAEEYKWLNMSIRVSDGSDTPGTFEAEVSTEGSEQFFRFGDQITETDVSSGDWKNVSIDLSGNGLSGGLNYVYIYNADQNLHQIDWIKVSALE